MFIQTRELILGQVKYWPSGTHTQYTLCVLVRITMRTIIR